MNQQKEINKFKDELIKHWDVSSDKLLVILEKMFKKLPGSYFEHSEILKSLLQYFENSKFNIALIELYDKPSPLSHKENMEVVDPTEENPDIVKYRIVKEWILKKIINVTTEFYLSLSIADVKIKKWIDLEYEISYLQSQIKKIDDLLWKEPTSEDNTLFEINNQFIMGEYPNVFSENLDIISYVEALILFRKFLKARLAKKQPSFNQEQLTIQGEIKGEKDYLGNLTLTLPLKQIEQSLKEALHKEINDTSVPDPKNEIKLYTLKETAKMLGVSLQTLNDWTKKGIIQKHRIGDKQIRIKREDIEKAIRRVEVIPFQKRP